MKTRKLRMVRWRASQCLGNTSTFGESLADCMDKISIICTCNREVYSNQRLFCYRVVFKKGKRKIIKHIPSLKGEISRAVISAKRQAQRG